MSNELTYQQYEVYRRLEDTLKFSRESIRGIRARGSMLCIASTALVGVITAAKFLPEQQTGTNFESFVLGLVCFCTAAMYWFVSQLWGCWNAPSAGSLDTDVLFEEYLSQTKAIAYNNFLIDLAATVKMELIESDGIGGKLDMIVRIFQCQIALLALAILWQPLAAFCVWASSVALPW